MSYVNTVAAIQPLSTGDLPDVGVSSLWTDTPWSLHEVCMQPLTDFMNCGFETPLPLWTSWLCPHQIRKPASVGQARHLDSAEEASANHRGWLWSNKQTYREAYFLTAPPCFSLLQFSHINIFFLLQDLQQLNSAGGVHWKSTNSVWSNRCNFHASDHTPKLFIPCTLFDEVGLSFILWAFFSSLIHQAWWEMPANDIQLGKGYISPSALQFAAVWPLTKPCLGIITVCSPSYRQVDPMWDKYKESPEVVQETKSQRRKRTKLMLVCAAAM